MNMNKNDEILLTIAVIVLLLTIILAVLLWQMRSRREKMHSREALTAQLTRENAAMADRLKRQGIETPENITADEETNNIKTDEEI